MKKVLSTAAFAASMFVASTANAVTIGLEYFLDVSNDLPDGDYGTVLIEDNGDTGNVDFTITVNSDAFNLDGATNFGLQTFSFNYDITGLAAEADAPRIINLDPSTWEVTNTKGSISEFGKFDFDLAGDGNDRTTVLSFSITGVVDDSIANYALGATEGSEYFAAHIAGFSEMDCLSGTCTSAFFAGDGSDDRGITPPVPVPAAAWLFASGLIGLVGVARREDIA